MLQHDMDTIHLEVGKRQYGKKAKNTVKHDQSYEYLNQQNLADMQDQMITMDHISRMRPNAHLEHIVRQHEYLQEQIQGAHTIQTSRLKSSLAKKIEELENENVAMLEQQKREYESLLSEYEQVQQRYSMLADESHAYRTSLLQQQEENRELQQQIPLLTNMLQNKEKIIEDLEEEISSMLKRTGPITQSGSTMTELAMSEIDVLNERASKIDKRDAQKKSDAFAQSYPQRNKKNPLTDVDLKELCSRQSEATTAKKRK
jgi:predicted RNase H-like nuclease (RuvC/YqgF family)